MQQEEKHKRGCWHAEWKCAERLLFAQGDQTAIEHDQDMVRKFESKTAHTLSTPVGGGYVYQTCQRKLGLEELFEHKSALPWTASSDTMAIGQKGLAFDSSQARIPKFPPSREAH